MILGVLRLDFRLHGNDSLKGKRHVCVSLKQKLRNKFNVSVSEIEAQDCLERLVLAVAMVSNDSKRVQSQLDKALELAQAATSEELIDSDMELFSSGDSRDDTMQDII